MTDLVTENAEFTTTFWSDFSIADRFGLAAVRDTFNRTFKEWRGDYRYLTSLVMTLNHKIWQHYQKNEPLALLYHDLWGKADSWAWDNLTGDELEYFHQVTD